jgi:hypothetical protein
MADELQYYGDPATETGLTVTADVYDSDGVEVATGISCTEVGVLAIYQGDMPATGVGVYAVRFFNGSALLGSGCIIWNGAAEVNDLFLDELHKLEGLDSANPVTTTPTSRNAGSVSQVISGDGITTSTVTRS